MVFLLRLSLGPLVKWLRHRPFTAVTWVRVPYGSPKKRESEQDSLFFGAAPPARDNPLRSNAKGDSHPLSRSPHADLSAGSDFKFTSSPKTKASPSGGAFVFDCFVPRGTRTERCKETCRRHVSAARRPARRRGIPYGSPEKRESELDSLFCGDASTARDDPLRSNMASGSSPPLSHSPHTGLSVGSGSVT